MKAATHCLGLDLGGTAIKFGICSINGEIVEEFIRPSEASASVPEMLKYLAEAAQEALWKAKEKGLDISAIGLGTPGNVDVNTGFLKGGTPNFTHWQNVAIKESLESQLSIPVFVDNDANLMIYGEYLFGAGKGFENVVGITLGTGIGGGVIIGGEIFRGSNFAGSELGHISIDYTGNKCPCGGRGCWETYASATAMIKKYIELTSNGEISSTREIFERYRHQDVIAARVIAEEIELVAVGIVSLINIFNPEVFIIGGGLSEAGDWFIEKISRSVNEHAMEESRKGVKIVPAQLGNSAGWLGAAVFAYHQLESFSDK